jgi:hypothetical protein
MSAWIPLVTGLLAFGGVFLGHFVAFDLNAAARRREVRRSQIERLAELMNEDTIYIREYIREALFRTGNFPPGPNPAKKAAAIQMLYFQQELATEMNAFEEARFQYEQRIDSAYLARLRAVTPQQPIEKTFVSDAQIEEIKSLHPAYYRGVLNVLKVASTIALETIPEGSHAFKCFDRVWKRIRGKTS